MKIKILLIVIPAILSLPKLYGQEIHSDTLKNDKEVKFKYRALIIPGLLITYGVIGLENHQLLFENAEVKEEFNEHIDEKVSVDDFTQYLPALSVYGLNLLNIKGKNNFKDRTTILATSYFIMSGVVLSTKSLCKVERPDGSSNNSFPSGHTATAFMGAEFLWQEYKDVSKWYGITGYAVAAGTGIFRMYNNRHWLTDVAAGAGIGMLSTKIAYWIHPFVKNKIFKTKNRKPVCVVTPLYNNKQAGLRAFVSF